VAAWGGQAPTLAQAFRVGQSIAIG
jgi:hypothetical protein